MTSDREDDNAEQDAADAVRASADPEVDPVIGSEDFCPVAKDDKHEPDFATAHIESDGGEYYVDVNCKHCGRSGCLGQLQNMLGNLQW